LTDGKGSFFWSQIVLATTRPVGNDAASLEKAPVAAIGRRGFLVVTLLCLSIGGLVASGTIWYRAELARAESEIKSGQPSAARARLSRMTALGLRGLEVQYWLAACAEAEGRVDEALERWAKIPRDSSRYVNATLRRARLAIDKGRLAVAEDALENASFPNGSKAQELHEVMLQQVYLFIGRSDELRLRKELEWKTARDKAGVLRKHWLIDETRAYAVGALRERLEADGRSAPDDDRVWLGKADLAIRTAQYDQADQWLRKCLERRPKDSAVWRTRLEWAVAANRVTEAQQAMDHLAVDRLSSQRLLAVRAWLAGQVGNPKAEREAWSTLLDEVPGDSIAVARLTEIEARANRANEVARLRARKLAIDRATEAYRKILNAGTPTAHFDELGELAETLGRWFEARGWWSLALTGGAEADRVRAAIARVDLRQRKSESIAKIERSKSITGTEMTVADWLSDILPRQHGRSLVAATGATASVPLFRDDAKSAGLEFTYHNDVTPKCRMPETMGGGVGLIDYDGDGWLDVYAVQGGVLSDQSPLEPTAQRDRLFRNRGDGTFEDVTVRAGLMAFPGGYGHGVTVGDYDNDGRPDLFVTRWRSYALYHNRGDGTFEDATASAGLSGSRDWPTSSALGDIDGDGDLDLYVCHYSAWDPRTSPPCPFPGKPDRFTYCGPRVFDAMPDHLFRNDGGHFVDVSAEAGVTAADTEGRGLGVVAADFDDDGRTDLFVANDLTANFLFKNRGGWRFQEAGAESGTATNAEGGFLAGMGVACGDLDGDGRLDLAVTNFYGESTTFYKNLGGGQFVDRTAAIGLAAPSRYLLGFGAAFLDANNDGRLDLATANGHVNDLRPNVPFAMPAQLLLGQRGGRLVDVSSVAGEPWSKPRVGRGLAVGDLDNDGRLDLVIVAQGEPLAYFHNSGETGHFVTFLLEGAAPRSNRDAVGARVTITAGGMHQVAERTGGGSFLSANSGRIHFGLADNERIDSVELRWPSGRVDHFTNLRADTAYLLREGQATPSTPAGWRRPSARQEDAPRPPKA
jgi:tetratricopeptide (TPR) repeat protein